MKKIRLKKPEYVPFQRDNDIRLPCDNDYDRASATYDRARKVLADVVYKCLIATARALADACRLFASDPSLTQLQAGLRHGAGASDLIEIGNSLRQFESTVNTGNIDFSEGSAEGGMVFAVQCLHSAIAHASNDENDDAYRDTVRCRSAISHLVK